MSPSSVATPTGKKQSLSTTPHLLSQGEEAYDKLQGNHHVAASTGRHSYLIYVLKHKEPLHDSHIETLHNDN